MFFFFFFFNDTATTEIYTLSLHDALPIAPPPLQPDDIAVLALPHAGQIRRGHHAAIADKHDTAKAEARFEIVQHVGYGLRGAPVAGEDMVRERPAIDEYEPDQHLAIPRLAIAAVPVGGEQRRAVPFEVGRRQVVEHAIDLEREEIAQPQVQFVLDGEASRGQLIQRAVPLLELAKAHAHAGPPAGPTLGVVAPLRQPATPPAIAHEIRL